MQIQEFQQNRFIRNFIKDKWLIFASTGVLMVFALIYVLTMFQPTFKSESKVWIKDTATRSYLSEKQDEPGYLSSLTQAGNPVMTQSELLTSKEMSDYLSDYVARHQPKSKWADTNSDGRPDLEKRIKVKTEPNTDVIEVSLTWNDPVLSRNLLKTALEKLDETNLAINRQIYTRKSSYIGEQLKDIDQKLSAVRQRIRKFQAGNLTVDIDSQTQELVRLKTQLVAQLEGVNASRKNNSGNANSLQRQLAMNPAQALRAVALGSGNENLVKMRSDLALLKQQYAKDSVKLAPTNPSMVAAKSQIEELEAQVKSEISQTGGNAAATGPLIFDNVRSQLVQDLASSNARSVGLGSEAASLTAAINRVDTALKNIPQSRYTLTGLQDEEKALSLAYDELSKRDIEAKIREAETPSNVFVVDSPDIPEKASFPTGTHLILLSALLGLGVGMGLSAWKTYSEDLCEDAESVALATRGKVLGVIPWVENPGHVGGDGSLFAMNDMACKHIISNMRIEADRFDAKAIAFTSSSFEKPNSSSAYHLAQCMSRLGQTVAFIEADLRPSNLLNLVPDKTAGVELSDLILSTDLKLRSGQTVFPEEVTNALTRDANGIYLALNRQPVENAYDYFASRGFRHILSALKEQFDWVFIDTPAAAIAPEFTAIAHISDGVVMFADRKATSKTLGAIADKIREAGVPLLGSIVREKNSRLEFEQEVYTNWRGPKGGGGLPVGASGRSNYGSKRVEFMGAKIDALSMRETLDCISRTIETNGRMQHVVVNVAKLVNMSHDKKLRDIVNECDLINADGAGIVMGAKLLGVNIPERVAGIDLMHQLVGMSSRKEYRIFFLGAEEEVVRDVVSHYKKMYPDLNICGYRNGYFKPEEEVKLAKQIRDAKPDILFVAMSSPKKEKFIAKHKETMQVPFVMGVGGSFDVVAGKVKRAPVWMQNSGLEWFYRLAQEPGRMWKRYLFTNVEFGWMLAGKAVSAKLGLANG